MDEPVYVASCSFGKDSLAAIIAAEEHGVHINDAVYCRIMFDDNISAELPEHDEFIYQTAIPILKSRYGIETTVVESKQTYVEGFYSVRQKGNRAGSIVGFPFQHGPWCNSQLKVRTLNACRRKMVEKYGASVIEVVGIAADETKRIGRKTEKNKWLPLVEYGIPEADTFEMCRKEGLLSPAYNKGRTRLGCWFCHNQRLNEYRRLRKEYPEYWQRLLDLDADSPVTFRPGDITVKSLDDRFASEDAQLSIFDFIEDSEEGNEP